MKSNYKRLGDFIKPYHQFNDNMEITDLLGISNNKYFQRSHTNTIGIDLRTYRIVRTNQFAYNRATTRNGDKISIALRQGPDCIVSPSYRVFEVKDENELLPEYLMMWFRRPEFDRYARFKSHGSAHEFFEYEEMCDVMLPVPHPDKQREIVREYNVITNRITLNRQLNQKLEETAQAIYKQWFVDFEFPDAEGKPYKTNGGEMEYCKELDKEIPKGWRKGTLEELLVLNYGKSLTGTSRVSGNIKVYSSAGVTGYHDTALVNEPSIIVGRKGSIGTVYYETQPFFCIDTAYYILQSECKSPIIYLFDLLRKLDLRNMNEDSAVPGLNRNTVYAIEIIVPDDNTIIIYSKIIEKIFTSIRTFENENDALNNISNTLLSKLSSLN